MIDSITLEEIDYHFEIQNIGKLPATSIVPKEVRNDGLSHENLTHLNDLAPGSKCIIDSPPRFNREGLATGLTLNFQSKVRGETMNFKTEFSFNIRSQMLKPGVFSYSNSKLNSSESMDITNLYTKAFKMPHGLIMLQVPQFGLLARLMSAVLQAGKLPIT